MPSVRLLLTLCGLLAVAVSGYSAPMRNQYADIQSRLDQIVVSPSLLPPGPFTFAHCDDYTCDRVTDAADREGLACHGQTAEPFHDFILLYLAANGSLSVRNTDQSYATMCAFVECLGKEFPPVLNTVPGWPGFSYDPDNTFVLSLRAGSAPDETSQ